MANSFLDNYKILHEETEVHPEFALWCGLCGMSACLTRSVCLDMGVFQVYPNLYVVLVAGSGRQRKSTAIGMIERPLQVIENGPNLIGQKITPEALINALKVPIVDGQDNNNDDDSETVSQGFIVVDELTTLLNRKSYDSGLGALLITLFDCKDRFEYETRTRGKETLRNMYMGLLGGSTVEGVRRAVPEEAIGEGLTSRIIFVYVDDPMPPVPRPRTTERKQLALAGVLEHLRLLRDLKGMIALTEEAWELYDNEYKIFQKTSPFWENGLLSGYASRRFVHLLKLGILFAVSDDPLTLRVSARNLHQAKLTLEETEKNLPRVISMLSTTDGGSNNEFVFSIIEKGKRQGVSREELIKQASSRMDYQEIAAAITTLVQGGRIKVRDFGQGKVLLHAVG